MDNEQHYSTWNAPPPIPRGDSAPSRGMPQSGGARGLPDLNFPPEDQGITEEPSNPQHGPSNPQPRSSNPQSRSSSPQPRSSNPQHGPSNSQPGSSNPQPGSSNPEGGSNSPEQDPPDKSFFQARVLNPKPFFTGKMAEALEGMKKLLVRIRSRSKREKEGGTAKRKTTRKGQPKSKDRRKRTKRTPGDDMKM